MSEDCARTGTQSDTKTNNPTMWVFMAKLCSDNAGPILAQPLSDQGPRNEIFMEIFLGLRDRELRRNRKCPLLGSADRRDILD